MCYFLIYFSMDPVVFVQLFHTILFGWFMKVCPDYWMVNKLTSLIDRGAMITTIQLLYKTLGCSSQVP